MVGKARQLQADFMLFVVVIFSIAIVVVGFVHMVSINSKIALRTGYDGLRDRD